MHLSALCVSSGREGVGARGCLNAGVAHVDIRCISGDCSRQHGKIQNRSASQMF